MIRKGEAWGRPATGPADVECHGDDRALASLAAARPGVRVRFVPDEGSDLARAVGLGTASTADDPAPATELPVDGMMTGDGRFALNMLVVGPAPDRLRAWHRSRHVTLTVDGRVRFDSRATTVVIASGQFLRGLDVVPRGHPGDGRLEVQVYALPRPARREMRRRLPAGEHVPHPAILQVAGRHVEVRVDPAAPLEADGAVLGPGSDLVVDVVPGAAVLLV